MTDSLVLAELRALAAGVERLNSSLTSLRAEIHAGKVNQKTGREVRVERRHKLIREIAKAISCGSTKATATATMLVIIGTNRPPFGAEAAVQKLQQQYRGERLPCIRTIERILERDCDTNDI